MLLSKATYSTFRLYIILSVCVFPGNWTHNLCAANAMLYHWATGTLFVWLIIKCESIILIQIIKWMPPYWDNKALPTPTLTQPDTLFLTFRLFSWLLKINAFPMWNEIWKGRIKKRIARVDRVIMTTHFTLYCSSTSVFCWLAQSHVGGWS